jgi:hypothetical protein
VSSQTIRALQAPADQPGFRRPLYSRLRRFPGVASGYSKKLSLMSLPWNATGLNRVLQLLGLEDKEGFPAVTLAHLDGVLPPQFADFPAQRLARASDHPCKLCLVEIDPDSILSFYAESSR